MVRTLALHWTKIAEHQILAPSFSRDGIPLNIDFCTYPAGRNAHMPIFLSACLVHRVISCSTLRADPSVLGSLSALALRWLRPVDHIHDLTGQWMGISYP